MPFQVERTQGQVIHTPPHNKHHSTNYNSPRVLLPGTNEPWKLRVVEALQGYNVELFDSRGDAEWEFEHSFICTTIPLVFEFSEDSSLLHLLGQHSRSGKLIPHVIPTYPNISIVQAVCDFHGITLYHAQDSWIKSLITKVNESLP